MRQTNYFYPKNNASCYWKQKSGGCTFCGFTALGGKYAPSKSTPPSRLIRNFRKFTLKNHDFIMKKGYLSICPNGGMFTEVPPELRQEIYSYAGKYGIKLTYDSRAQVVLGGEEWLSHELKQACKDAISEVKVNHIVVFGLEVANDADLVKINKGTALSDFEQAANAVLSKGAGVGVNILIGPPMVEDPIRKAFETVKYAVEVLKATYVYIGACVPMGAKSKEAYNSGAWNPVSPSEASEIFRQIKLLYPDIIVDYSNQAVHMKHRKPLGVVRYSAKEQERQRQNVREMCAAVFGTA